MRVEEKEHMGEREEERMRKGEKRGVNRRKEEAQEGDSAAYRLS